jgi:CheY-like chemotaxis protein
VQIPLRERGPRYKGSPPRPRVLLVEDNPLVRGAAVRALKRYFALTTAASGEEALGRFRSGAFDAVVTDYQMPAMTGIELLEQIRLLDPRVRRVLVTAANIPGLAGYIGTGIVEQCWFKPIDLLTALRELLITRPEPS